MDRWAWAVAAALLAACGNGPAHSAAGRTDGGNGNDGVPGPGSGTAPCNGQFTVFVAATDPGDVQQLDLLPAGVDLAGSGGAIQPTFVATNVVSFPAPGAFQIAVAPVPAGGGTVDVAIRLANVNVTEGGSTTSVDLCSAPLSFRFDTSRISPTSCHVVAILDLARSVAAGPSGPVFLPNYTIHY
jgi:hypothetical protein